MLDVILLRVAVFLAAFLGMQQALRFMGYTEPSLPRALAVLAAATLIAFVTAALVLGEGLGRSLTAWVLVYGIIAGIWFLRYRARAYEDEMRRLEEAVREDIEREERNKRASEPDTPPPRQS